MGQIEEFHQAGIERYNDLMREAEEYHLAQAVTEKNLSAEQPTQAVGHPLVSLLSWTVALWATLTHSRCPEN